uniref:uncharacterized protein LOC109965727 isoform X2 n=1 Tax=Monopterus albus TaxID=43700 RepID=UPI0009B358E8|nr:uncharacterized protein LOC109965727 isoform X2 [Monopterus albus]
MTGMFAYPTFLLCTSTGDAAQEKCIKTNSRSQRLVRPRSKARMCAFSSHSRLINTERNHMQKGPCVGSVFGAHCHMQAAKATVCGSWLSERNKQRPLLSHNETSQWHRHTQLKLMGPVGLALKVLMEQSPERSPFDTHGNDKQALTAYHWIPMADGKCGSCNNTFLYPLGMLSASDVAFNRHREHLLKQPGDLMKSQSGTIISQRRSINVLQNSLWRSMMTIGLYSFDRCFKFCPR